MVQFDPFQDRLSRDIRNDLSAVILEVLTSSDCTPAQRVAETYLARNLHPVYRRYIEERLARYQAVVDSREYPEMDLFRLALVLWNHRLFFEVHEVLEHLWQQAEGVEREVIQALIRAAGVYIKLEYGYGESARKIAGKALPVLRKHRSFLSQYFELQPLMAALESLSPPPTLLTR